MNNMMKATEARLQSLIAAQRDGFSLTQEFYTDPEIFRADMARLFMNEWLFVGHASELKNHGDYVTHEVSGESVIIVKGKDGVIRALANVCRHRGSRVCLKPRGNAKRFTCPYHAWMYDLDGTLLRARLAGQEYDGKEYGLKEVKMEIFEGLIFISMSDNPPSFAGIRREIEPHIKPFGLDKLKIAHRKSYPVAANWKLLVENYNECYHCAAAHPEYSRSHGLHMEPAKMQPFTEGMEERARAVGVPTQFVSRIGNERPDGEFDYSLGRYPLLHDYKTGSEDGEPLAPLLGDLTGYDCGTSDMYIGVLNPMLIYNDHVVIYRFHPVDEKTSVQEIIWLVREDAEEGKDYDLEKLIWLWDVTTESDKDIIEWNQQGVNSRWYEPGPYTPMEAWAKGFVDSYLKIMSQS